MALQKHKKSLDVISIDTHNAELRDNPTRLKMKKNDVGSMKTLRVETTVGNFKTHDTSDVPFKIILQDVELLSEAMFLKNQTDSQQLTLRTTFKHEHLLLHIFRRRTQFPDFAFNGIVWLVESMAAAS